MEAEAKKFFLDDYVDNKEGRSQKAAKHMVEHLTGRAWILHEVGEDIFEFTHRTFLEYFYAKFLESRYEDTSELAKTSIPYTLEGQKTVPTHLALQIRTKDKRRASSKVADALGSAVVDHPNQYSLLEFCLDSLSYILPDAKHLTSFIEKLAPQIFLQDDPIFAYRLLCNNGPLANLILMNSESFLYSHTKVADTARLSTALFGLKTIADHNCSELGEQARQVVNEYLGLVTDKQNRSPFICKMVFDLDGELNDSAAKRFGFRLWFNNQTSRYASIALAVDSRIMVTEAASNLKNSEYIGGKHLALAKLIMEECSNSDRKFEVENTFYGDKTTTESHLGPFELTFDPETWREDPEALELYAFTLALFTVSNWLSLKKETITKIEAALVNLVDLMGKSRPSANLFYSNWLARSNSLLSNKYFKAEYFLDVASE